MVALLSWGIMGCGWVARDYGGPAIEASCNGRLAALYDPNPDSLARAAALFPGAAAHGDLGGFLAVMRAPSGLGAAYIATPNHVHRALVEAAAGAGLAVLCEKPMATTLADADTMIAACRSNGVRYATAFDQRFHGAHLVMARMIAAGRLGTVTAVRVVYGCWLPADWAGDNWRIDPHRAGGGAMMDLAPHGLDLAATLLGEPLVDVVAMGQARVHRYGVEDGAVLLARSRSGALVQMHVAYNCPETLPRRRLEVVGTAGQLVATDTMGQVGGGTLIFLDAATGVAEPVAVPGIERSPFVNQVEAFAAAVLGTGNFPFTPEGDLVTMRLLLQAQGQANPQVAAPGLPDAA